MEGEHRQQVDLLDLHTYASVDGTLSSLQESTVSQASNGKKKVLLWSSIIFVIICVIGGAACITASFVLDKTDHQMETKAASVTATNDGKI